MSANNDLIIQEKLSPSQKKILTGLDSKSSSEHNITESLDVIRPASLTKYPNVPQQFTSHTSLSPSETRKFELDRK